MAPKKDTNDNTVALNRKAWRDFSIEEEIEAGLVLLGTEVKSLRAGRANIADAYAAAQNDEIWLFNASIIPYSHGNRQNHEERRPRKLLLHKKQVEKLIGRLKVKGVTLAPLALYFNARGVAKIKMGIATGKKEYEKRADIKKRDWQRDKARIMREKNN
jgi:SsrA-binding protein